ncbi:MAG: hypothetical protein ACC682_07215 [Gemmatimonadota bacterium]
MREEIALSSRIVLAVTGSLGTRAVFLELSKPGGDRSAGPATVWTVRSERSIDALPPAINVAHATPCALD